MQSMSKSMERKVIHYPNLDTVLMVEEFLKEHSGEFKKKSLWQHLPRKVMYQTFVLIIDYLYDSGKIAYDKEGKIAWIWNPELVRRYLMDERLTSTSSPRNTRIGRPRRISSSSRGRRTGLPHSSHYRSSRARCVGSSLSYR